MLLVMLVVLHGNANKLGNKNASEYTTNDKFAVLKGNMTLSANTDGTGATEKQTVLKINFPDGFNKDNCVCIAFGMKRDDVSKYYSYGVAGSSSIRHTTGSYNRFAQLGASDDTTKIGLQVWNPSTSSVVVNYKLVLMRID